MCDDPPYTPGSSSKNRKWHSKGEDAPDLECATPELSQGYRLDTWLLKKCYKWNWIKVT